VDTTPSWLVPHSFWRPSAGGSNWELVATYGLFAPLLFDADVSTAEGVRQLAERAGLAALATIASPPARNAAAVRKWLDGMEAAEAHGKRPPGPPSDAVVRSVGAGLQTLRTEIAPLTRLIAAAAEAGDDLDPLRPRADAELVECLERLSDVYYRGGLRLEQMRRRDGTPTWAFNFRSLQERVVVELLDIFTIGVRLRRCTFCRRVTIGKNRRERECYFGLWTLPNWKHAEPCAPAADAFNEHISATEHQRTRKRLWANQARKAGTVEEAAAKKLLESYMSKHRQQPGPKARPPRRPPSDGTTMRVDLS